MKKTLSRMFDGIIELFSSLALILMFCVVMYGIYARYYVARPGFWIEEMARHSMFVMTMIGAAAALSKSLHPALTAIADKLRGTAKFAIDMWVEVLVLASILAIVYAGAAFALESTRIRTVGLRIPYAYVYSFIPLGFALMGIVTLRRIVNCWRNRNAVPPPPSGEGGA